MAGQGLLFRCLNAVSGSRLLFNNNRIWQAQAVPIAGLKDATKEKLKQLNIPEKPKKPLSPYIRFVKEHQEVIRKQHPDWRMPEVIKRCSMDWKDCHPTIKEKYEKEFIDELASYSLKAQAYEEKLTDEQELALDEAKQEKLDAKKRREKKKKNRDLNKPKRPLSAYLMFVKDFSQNKKMKLTDLVKEVQSSWAEMDPVRKNKYIESAGVEFQKYEQLMEAWEKKMIQEGNSDLVRQKTLLNYQSVSTKQGLKSGKKA